MLYPLVRSYFHLTDVMSTCKKLYPLVRCYIHLSDVMSTCQKLYPFVRCYIHLADVMFTCQVLCPHVRCYVHLSEVYPLVRCYIYLSEVISTWQMLFPLVRCYIHSSEVMSTCQLLCPLVRSYFHLTDVMSTCQKLFPLVRCYIHLSDLYPFDRCYIHLSDGISTCQMLSQLNIRKKQHVANRVAQTVYGNVLNDLINQQKTKPVELTYRCDTISKRFDMWMLLSDKWTELCHHNFNSLTIFGREHLLRTLTHIPFRNMILIRFTLKTASVTMQSAALERVKKGLNESFICSFTFTQNLIYNMIQLLCTAIFKTRVLLPMIKIFFFYIS